MSLNQYIVAITVCTDDLGTTATHYFTTGTGFCTKPTDTPANTWVQPRLLNAGNIRRELFTGNRTFGAVRPSFGEITIANQDGALDAWLGYAVDGRTVKIYWGPEGADFPAGYTLVYQCIGASLAADFDVLRVRIKDRLYLLDKPVLNSTFAGTGGLEGPSGMAGRAKQRVLSDPGYVPVVMVDSTNLIYFVQCDWDGGLASSFALYDGGVPITRQSDYASDADVVSTPPSSGYCRFRFNTSTGVWVRLGSTPAFDLRCWVKGLSYPYTSGYVAGVLAREAGITDAALIGPASYTLVDNTSTTYAQVIDEAANASLYWYGMSRADAFVSDVFSVPAASGEYTFTQHNAWGFRRDAQQDLLTPIYSISVNNGKTWPCTCAGAASAAMRDYLSRDPWWSSWTYEDAGVKTKHAAAAALMFDQPHRSIQNSTTWEALRDKWMALFSVDRDLIQLTCALDANTLAIDLADTVTVQIQRFGLSAGKNFRVVAQTLDLNRSEITLGLWG